MWNIEILFKICLSIHVKLLQREIEIIFGAAPISDEPRKWFQLSLQNFLKMMLEAWNLTQMLKNGSHNHNLKSEFF